MLPIAVLAVDASRRAVWWNREAGRIWRPALDAPPDLDRRHLRPVGAESRGRRDPVTDALEGRIHSTDVPVRILRGDGVPATVSMSAAPTTLDDGSAGAILTATDITERSELEEVRDAFIGLLAHELRTPITSLFGGVGLLQRDDLSAEVRRSVIDDLSSETDRLNRLVEDLLIVARLEKGVALLGHDPVLLQHVLARSIRAERQHWPRHRFELAAAPDLPPVGGEDGPVEQVVRNLVSNAAKYGPADGLVDVRAEHVGDEVRVTVLDDGPGIPDWAIDDVFRLFYRVPKTDGGMPGTGIGLFMSRVIVESIGGRIWASTRPAGGAEVGFALPVYAASDEG